MNCQFFCRLLFICMTCFHLFANYKAVTSLVFDTFNKDRLTFTLNAYLRNCTVPSPKDANANESPFWSWRTNSVINLGASIGHCLKETDFSTIKKALEEDVFCSVASEGRVDVVLSDRCRPKDLLRGYCAAMAKVNNDNDFNFEDFDHKAQKQGWKTTHLQINTLGWKCSI